MGPSEFMMRWPEADPKHLPLFQQLGAPAICLPIAAPGELPRFLADCRSAGIRVLAELGAGDAAGLAKARQAGFDGAVLEAPDNERRVRQLAAQYQGWELFVCLKPEQIHWRVEPARVVLRAGLWPGSRRSDPALAGASQAVWLDANSYLVSYLRGLYSEREALLGYRPDEDAGVAKDQRVPYHSVELALAEAAAAGGRLILTLPEHYRQALLKGESRAQAAWNSLVETARFLKQQENTFHLPLGARVVTAVAGLEDCAEILNLLYRHNVSPAVVGHGAIPAFGRFQILVTVGLDKQPAGAKAALEFARAGGKVLVVPASGSEKPWWTAPGSSRLRSEESREFYRLGKGIIIAYREPVSDPGEFALDVIDAMGWRRRDLRIWGTSALIGLLHRHPGGGLSVELLNYGGSERDFLVRVEGAFSRATLRTPQAPLRALRAARRGTGTEIEVPGVNRVASLLLE